MTTLGALWSQTIGFSVSTTAGTTYAHSLGYTPTIVLLTPNITLGSSAAQFGYTAANTVNVLITVNNLVAAVTTDVLVGSFHSLIK